MTHMEFAHRFKIKSN